MVFGCALSPVTFVLACLGVARISVVAKYVLLSITSPGAASLPSLAASLTRSREPTWRVLLLGVLGLVACG